MQGPTSVYSEPTWLDTPLRTKGGPAARTDHRSPAPRAPGRPGTSSAPSAAGGEGRSGAATFPCLPPRPLPAQDLPEEAKDAPQADPWPALFQDLASASPARAPSQARRGPHPVSPSGVPAPGRPAFESLQRQGSPASNAGAPSKPLSVLLCSPFLSADANPLSTAKP